MAKKKNSEETAAKAENKEVKEEKAEEKEVKKEKKAKEESNEEKLQKELAEKSDQLLRIAAEYDNFRKRSQREKDALYIDCKASVIKELLPVADNFDRIFANPDITFEDYKKGVEMTFKQFETVFKDLKVESFGEEGEEFDPNFHNAVMHSEDENLGENVITNVFAKGYKIGDKVIRPAMVAVAN
ncbi:MAG TPA: nucleotide exchange factor GrpE [Ruminococcaceae bacterium]|nr:nucleotide exchange factor GrpE [Oscillospiraceae bacterium]